MPGEVIVKFIALLSLFVTARKAPFVEEKPIKSPKIPARSSSVGSSKGDKRDGELCSL